MQRSKTAWPSKCDQRRRTASAEAQTRRAKIRQIRVVYGRLASEGALLVPRGNPKILRPRRSVFEGLTRTCIVRRAPREPLIRKITNIAIVMFFILVVLTLLVSSNSIETHPRFTLPKPIGHKPIHTNASPERAQNYYARHEAYSKRSCLL